MKLMVGYSPILKLLIFDYDKRNYLLVNLCLAVRYRYLFLQLTNSYFMLKV